MLLVREEVGTKRQEFLQYVKIYSWEEQCNCWGWRALRKQPDTEKSQSQWCGAITIPVFDLVLVVRGGCVLIGVFE